MQINQDCVERLHGIAKQAGAGGATLFVFDRSAPEQPLHFLHNLGLSVETNHTYQTQICQQDPFLRHAAAKPAEDTDGLCIIDQHEVEAEPLAPAARMYWEFMQRRGYCESAAATREISGGIYLVLGLMRAGPAPERLSARRVRDSTRALFDRTSEQLVQSALRRLIRETQTTTAPRITTAQLTRREREVVAAVARGLGNKQIADALQLSECTVENHLRRIYRRHGVHNRTSLIARLTAAAPP